MSDGRSIMEKLKDELVPSLASGAVGVLASSFLLGVDLSTQVPLGSINMPAWVAIGGVLTAADLAAYASHDYIIENISALKSISNYENRILAPALSGIASYALFATAISPDASLTNSVLLGAGSSVTGRYLADTVINKM